MVSSLATDSLDLKRFRGSRSMTLNNIKFTHNIYEIDDGDTMPITIMVDPDGFHLTQPDYNHGDDHISMSWEQLMGLFEVVERIEGMYQNGRH